MISLWNNVTSETDSSSRNELLRDVVSLFVNIRIFFLASSRLEKFKRDKGAGVAKTKALRKEIIKSSQK